MGKKTIFPEILKFDHIKPKRIINPKNLNIFIHSFFPSCSYDRDLTHSFSFIHSWSSQVKMDDGKQIHPSSHSPCDVTDLSWMERNHLHYQHNWPQWKSKEVAKKGWTCTYLCTEIICFTFFGFTTFLNCTSSLPHQFVHFCPFYKSIALNT